MYGLYTSVNVETFEKIKNLEHDAVAAGSGVAPHSNSLKVWFWRIWGFRCERLASRKVWVIKPEN